MSPRDASGCWHRGEKRSEIWSVQVACFGTLARNVVASLRVGDLVMVDGYLSGNGHSGDQVVRVHAKDIGLSLVRSPARSDRVVRVGKKPKTLEELNAAVLTVDDAEDDPRLAEALDVTPEKEKAP